MSGFERIRAEGGHPRTAGVRVGWGSARGGLHARHPVCNPRQYTISETSSPPLSSLLEQAQMPCQFLAQVFRGDGFLLRLHCVPEHAALLAEEF